VTERPSGSTEPADGTVATEPEPAPDRSDERRSSSGFWRELPVLIVIALALAILVKTFLVQAFYIPSGSMEPTLVPGDRVLVRKVLYSPDRFDVIVFEEPNGAAGPDRGVVGGFLHWLSEGLGFVHPENEDFIKRVIGLPGEQVELRNGRLYVDGIRTEEPYLSGRPDTRDYGPVIVPPDALFVLGDNRLHSNDSRFGLGFVPLDKVIGSAFVIVWPPSRVGWIH
jgi:signal peptidase I